MEIANNCVVSIHYTVKDESGMTLDSTYGKKPVVYMQGTQSIISGLQLALAGKTIGDHFQVTLSPNDAYGAVKAELIQKLPKKSFEGFENLQAGQQLQATNTNGSVQLFVVQEIDENFVTIDVNHPLAGLILKFDVQVEEVRLASDEELAMSHSH